MKFSDGQISLADLSILSPSERLQYSQFKLRKRKAEFYYTRKLWKSFEIDEPIVYDHAGRPLIKNGYVSISHSRDIVVIAYHPTHQIGIDAEYHSPKLREIAHKFISPQDARTSESLSDSELTIIWSIKEAVYKMEKLSGLSFKDHIHVRIQGKEANVDVQKEDEKHHYSFSYIDFGEYVICFCSHADLNGVTLY